MFIIIRVDLSPRFSFPLSPARRHRAKSDENIASLLKRAILPAFTGYGIKQEAEPPLPRIDSVPLPPAPSPAPLPESEFVATRGVYVLPLDEAARAREGRVRVGGEIPASPSGLTASDEVQRAVYHRAFLISRALAFASTVTAQASEVEVDREVAMRLSRKRAHVALRCGAAFSSVVSMMSQLQEKLSTSPLASSASFTAAASSSVSTVTPSAATGQAAGPTVSPNREIFMLFVLD